MKKIICVSLAFVIILSVMMTGCAPSYDKSPDQYTGIRWITPDYSFMINPKDSCKGFYKYNETKYNIKAEFQSTRMTVTHTDKNKELFFADWTYEEGEHLYVYNITFNSKDYKEFERNYAEFVRLNQEKL